ncbi:MAG: LamG domain-containing protein [Nitrospirae bacterium]|nr:LamG domain-containing protein [Nitrospirota bacterium]
MIPRRLCGGELHWNESFRIDPFTVCAWIKLDSSCSDSDMIFAIPSHAYWDNASGFAYKCNTNELEGYIYYYKWFTVSTELKNSFHFVCMTKDSQTGRLYAYGNLLTEMTDFDSIIDYGSPRSILLGADDDSNNDGSGDTHWFKGTLDDIRIYNRALSDSEIQELYQEVSGTIDVSLTPPTTTTVSKGNKFGPFSISITNNTSSSYPFYVYIYLVSPDETWKTLISKSLTLSGGGTLTANNLYTNIPSAATTGSYYYWVGAYDTS